MDPAKLKVYELRDELKARGLDQKGVKAVLIERLKEALEEETGQEIPESSILETSSEDTSLTENTDNQQQSSAGPDTELEKKLQEKENFSDPDSENYFNQDSEQGESPEQALQQFFEQEEKTQEKVKHSSKEEREPLTKEVHQTPVKGTLLTSESETPMASQGFGESEPTFDQDESQTRSDMAMEETSQDTDMEVSVKHEPHEDDFKEKNYEAKQQDFDSYQGYEVKKEEYDERDMKTEYMGAEVKDENQMDDRKRKRSRWSPQPDKGWGSGGPSWNRKDDEPELDDNAVVLGWYDSDLNLEISKSDFLEANPMSSQGFGFIWAGCRASFGFKHGRVCYEVKLLENNDVSHLEDEPSPHVLRVGWSILAASMLLGEEPFSYGYGGTGKSSTDCKFSNYGISFVVGDTITAYLDYGEEVKMSFSVNGVYQREAFNVSASKLGHKPLFPHILSKNIQFRANFGQRESEFPIEDGYTWAANVPVDQRVPGPRRPDNRSDCEMLMMCGLPGCGKTTWANKYAKENPDKFYSILGTNNLIDKMKIQGLARKRNYHGRWDVLIDKCTKCLNKLLDMAARRRRNYILDQTNVYPSAQKRKMRNFGGFIRRAIVIVPTDEEFQRRCEKREAEEGKDIPDSAVLEMKANFRLPEQGEHFDEVRYVELNEEESQPLVEQYNKEGREAGYGQSQFSSQGKKFRSNDRQPFRGGGGGGFRGGRGGGFGGGRERSGERGPGGGRGGGFRSGPQMKGGMDRGGRGGWAPRGGGGHMDRPRGGGWRDRSPQGFDRDADNRGPGGGAWRNNRNNDRDRPYDRNQRGSGGRGGRGGRDNFRDDDYGGGRGGFRDNTGGDYNSSGGFGRDDFSRGGRGGGFNSRDRNFDNRDSGGYRDGNRGGRGGGRGNSGGFDRDQQRGGGRGGFDRNRGGFNERRGGGGGGNRDGGFDRNRGPDRGGGPRDNKAALLPLPDPPHQFSIPPPALSQGGNANNSNNQANTSGQGGGGGGGGGSSWGNQGYNNSGWGQQGYNQQAGGFNQQAGGFNQAPPGFGQQQSFNQQPNQQATGWGQQAGWGNKGGGFTGTASQQQTPAVGATATPTGATPAATGYNTAAGYNQQAGYSQQQYAQGYWGQYGYGQGWTQNADGTYSYPQGWQQYGYNYGQTPATAAMGTQGAVATPATTAAPPPTATK